MKLSVPSLDELYWHPIPGISINKAVEIAADYGLRGLVFNGKVITFDWGFLQFAEMRQKALEDYWEVTGKKEPK
jgi:hypothetical protein